MLYTEYANYTQEEVFRWYENGTTISIHAVTLNVRPNDFVTNVTTWHIHPFWHLSLFAHTLLLHCLGQMPQTTKLHREQISWGQYGAHPGPVSTMYVCPMNFAIRVVALRLAQLCDDSADIGPTLGQHNYCFSASKVNLDTMGTKLKENTTLSGK